MFDSNRYACWVYQLESLFFSFETIDSSFIIETSTSLNYPIVVEELEQYRIDRAIKTNEKLLISKHLLTVNLTLTFYSLHSLHNE